MRRINRDDIENAILYDLSGGCKGEWLLVQTVPLVVRRFLRHAENYASWEGRADSEVRETLGRLHELGWIKRSKNGDYFLTSEGAKFLDSMAFPN